MKKNVMVVESAFLIVLEGALQIIDGKARLVSDLFCDGLGACIKSCPQGAMQIETRKAERYDEAKVMENIVKGGENVIKAHLVHLKEHNEEKLFNEATIFLKKKGYKLPSIKIEKALNNNFVKIDEKKRLQTTKKYNNWPIKLKLINSDMGYLKNASLLIASDCSAFSYPNFHSKFLGDKILIIFCPKLDSDIESYVEKLETIFKKNSIKSIDIIKMEVPCCSGIERVVEEAIRKAKKNILIKSFTIPVQEVGANTVRPLQVVLKIV